MVFKTGGELLRLVGRSEERKKGAEIIAKTLKDGSAMEKFKEMICAQGVSKEDADLMCDKSQDPFKVLPSSKNIVKIHSKQSGMHFTE